MFHHERPAPDDGLVEERDTHEGREDEEGPPAAPDTAEAPEPLQGHRIPVHPRGEEEKPEET